MTTISKSFTAKGTSNPLPMQAGQSFSYDISGTFVATIFLERSETGGQSWEAPNKTITGAASGTVTVDRSAWYRLRCTAYTSGTAVTELDEGVDTVSQVVSQSGTQVFATTDEGITTPKVTTQEILIENSYSGQGHSFQPIAVDLTLAATAGSDDGTDPSFIAPIMGNVLSDEAVAGEGNTLAGVIGAYSAVGAGGTDYPSAAVMGIIMDGSTDAKAIVGAVLDGSDPSSETRAGAAFGVFVNNNEGDSGVDYGLDLYATENPHYTDSPGDGRQGLNIAKAAIRLNDQTCWMTGAGAPVDGTTGDNFAGKGSIYSDTTNGILYIQTGAITAPTWVKVGTQS